MKSPSSVLIAILLMICFNHLSSQNTNYISNQSPLIETPFIQLPIGSVRAEGWLLKQLQLQKEGLTGHAESLYGGSNDLGAGSDWLGGNGDSWERVPYYTKGLVALAYVLDDQDLIDRAQKWIDWSVDTQLRTGFFGPAGNTDWWARMPMLYAIRDYYEATHDERIIPFFTKYFQYQNSNIDGRPLSSWGRSRAADNIDIVFWLYNRTGDAFLLELADKLHGQAYNWTDIFTNNKFNYFGTDFQPKHNVNVPQAMKMPVVYYQKSHAPEDKAAYRAGYEHLMRDHGQACGMQSGYEMLAGKSPATGLELCSVVEQMQTSEIAQMILGDVLIGDQLEQVAYNALPGGLTHDIKGLQYYQQNNQLISKHGYYGFGQNYDNGNMPGPYSGYGCCRFDFHMGWPYFVKTMWAATHDNGLAVMAYGPSTVTALVGDKKQVTIQETTDYPFDESLTFQLTTSEDIAFPLKLRIPAWCDSPQIQINGETLSDVISGEFYTINRTWKNKDVVTVSFPMEIQVHEEMNNAVSIQRGPIVYALKIEEEWLVRNNYDNGFNEYEVFPTSAWNYALSIDKNNPESSFQVNKKPMPENPYEQALTPVTLTVDAKRLNAWTLAFNGRIANDPPYGPVETESSRVYKVTLVPYGAETLRATVLPIIGNNVMITDEFTEDFEDGQQGWIQYGGSFYVDQGIYVATNTAASHPCSKSVVPATQFSDFTYDAQVQVASKGDGGLVFRANNFSFGPDDYNGYYVGINSNTNQVIVGKANEGWNQLATADYEININQWYHIRVVTEAADLKVFVDDMEVPKIELTDHSFKSGSIGLRSYQAITHWDDIRVVSTHASSATSLHQESRLIFYPNPARKILNVLVPYQGVLTIHNLLGNEVFSGDVNPGMKVLDTERFDAGIYILSISTQQDQSQNQVVQFVKV